LDSIDSHGFTDQVSQSAPTTSGVTWTSDTRYIGAQAATFNGSTSEAAQSVPSFDTSGSFSVAAWADPAATCSGNHTIVSMDADTVPASNHASAFTLNLDCTNMRWTMDVSDQNTATPNHASAASANGSAAVGRWTFLVGVFDRSVNQVQLWVDGT